MGTQTYMAPERLQGHKYAVESDVWSLGLSIIELATGTFPIPTDRPLPPLPAIATVQRPRPAAAPPAAGGGPAPPRMAVFELLSHIVNDDPPRLRTDAGFSPVFSEFCDLWYGLC